MFRITCFCDDKLLPKMLWALSELGAYNVESNPVKNNVMGNGAEQRHGQRLGVDGVTRAFLDYATKHKLRELRAPQLREFAVALGWAANSYMHVTKTLRATGLLTVKPGTHASGTAYLVRRDTKNLAQRIEKVAEQSRKERRIRKQQEAGAS